MPIKETLFEEPEVEGSSETQPWNGEDLEEETEEFDDQFGDEAQEAGADLVGELSTEGPVQNLDERESDAYQDPRDTTKVRPSKEGFDSEVEFEEFLGSMLQPPSGQKLKGVKVAVVGGGFAGLMAARTLCRQGAKVTVFEARKEVGGRVRSNNGKYSKEPIFSRGRITEYGAELVGSIHTRWCALAIEYGLALISRMDTKLYRGQQLNVKLTLEDKPLSMDEIRALDEAVDKVQFQIAELAAKINDPSQPWRTDPKMVGRRQEKVRQHVGRPSPRDVRGGAALEPIQNRTWRAALESLSVVAREHNVKPLDQLNFLGLLCLVKGGQSAMPCRRA